MTRATGVFALLLLLASPAVVAQRNVAGATQARLALERLNTTGSVLTIAAHPDDENTALLAWLARGRKVRTGYLSLTRGEGGQNLIGTEQGTLLGLIRTQELLAARRVDGAEQFFSTAVDFGFTKTTEETFAKWGREKILGDTVYVIRKFRPDVIVARFSGTPRDGHGQHQASAILAKDAFAAAADPKRFPEQLSEVQPWQAKRLMWNVFSFTRSQEKEAAGITEKIEIDLGAYDPLLGFSYSEIAGMSRSQHESQGMGSAERRGSQKNVFTTVAGESAKTDLLEGVATRWPEGDLRTLLNQALLRYKPDAPGDTIRFLLRARPLMPEERQAELDQAVAYCAGLWLDASADRASAAPGSMVKIRAEIVNRSTFPMELRSVSIVEGATFPGAAERLASNVPVTRVIEWRAQSVNKVARRAMPEADPALEARFDIAVDGTVISFVRPVWNRYVDKIHGELTQPFVTVPPVSVAFTEDTLMFPSAAAKQVAVQVRSWDGARSGTLRIHAPKGWTVSPAERSFALTQTGEERTLQFTVTPPAASSSVKMGASAVVNGQTLTSGVYVLRYRHIPPVTLYPEATTSLVRTDVKVLSKRVGYVMGAGDLIPVALRQMGCEVSMLTADDLARADLSRFDAIVAGVRAYNTRPDLRASYSRLMEYVQRGGTYVVQYNTAEGSVFSPVTGALERIGPYPLKLGNDRVTVEESQVEFLRANHPLLTAPNKITAADFEGWIQERGLYFASEWDPKYETMLSTHDPGEKPLPGGMLYTRYGKGAYVFTAYSWFRELPAGVPGAWRMFANILSAGKTP
ncbi:MAG: PIG-L family deacetylase [Bryobacteraceae bacterium]|nr:PIG-L family deacetylase [Bryobacteraceae bacterium]